MTKVSAPFKTVFTGNVSHLSCAGIIIKQVIPCASKCVNNFVLQFYVIHRNCDCKFSVGLLIWFMIYIIL